MPEARVAVADGLVIAGGHGELAAVRAADGVEVWRVTAEGSFRVAVAEGFAYTSGDGSGVLTQVDVTRGNDARTHEIGGADVLTPARDAGGVVVGHREGGPGPENGVVSLNGDGTEGWNQGTSKESRLETVTVSGERVILVTDMPLAAEALDRSTGDRKWLWEEQDGFPGGEMLGGGSVANEVLYLVGGTNGLTAIDIETGTKLWSAPIDRVHRDTRLVVTGGLVIATMPTDDGTGRVFALADPADPRFAALPTPSTVTRPPGPTPTTVPAPLFEVLDPGRPLEALPMGSSLAPDGTLYVVDTDGSRIVVRAPDGTIGSWDNPGKEQGPFNLAGGGSVSVSPDGSRIAVSEVANHRVLLFDGQRQLIRSFGRLGDGPQQFLSPGVTIDAQHRLWVVDGTRGDVQLFTGEGAYVMTFAGKGRAQDQLSGPGGASFREDTGELYIADFENRRISVWNEDGRWIRNYESHRDEGLVFDEINGVHVDEAGRMFVVDTTNRIFVLDPDGHLIATIPSVLPDPVGSVDVPAIALDRQGRLYLTDVAQRRIIVLQLLPPLWPPPG
jgi:outer membrane protein assembly factor BamB